MKKSRIEDTLRSVVPQVVSHMQDFGVDRITSLWDGIGEREPAFMFSFLGLGVSALMIGCEDIGRAVFEELTETLSGFWLRFIEEMRPR